MKKFIVKCLVFVLSITLFLNIYVNCSTKVMINFIGPSIEQQIDFSFKNALETNYDALILGNSRIYRGINPDKLDYAAYNFGNDQDSFNQCYHKLKYLESNNKQYKYIILGVDYFEFSFIDDRRNKGYKKYLGEIYLNDYKSKQNVNVLKYLNDDRINEILNSKFTQTIKPVIQQLSGQKNTSAHNILKKNGQYITIGEAKNSDTVKRNSNILPIQKRYYDKILQYANDKNIPIFLVLPPTRKNELKNYSSDVLEKFNKMFNEEHLNNKNAYFLNYTNDKNFQLKDYVDICHLNEDAADRFTIQLNNDIKEILNNDVKEKLNCNTKVMTNFIGPSIEQQIDFSFKNALETNCDTLILGNSKLYRGINPDKLDYTAYNFSNDQDSFNQCYHKLKYLVSKNKHYKYIILGVDYFEFSFLDHRRNKYYGKYLGKSYLNDYNSKQNVELLGQKNYNILKKNGQYITTGEAKNSDAVKRNSNILPIQKRYYDKILQYAKENNIPIFLVLPPTRENELENYSSDTIEKYNKLFNQAHLTNKNAYFLNYTNDKNFQLEDYVDICHLNKDAADRFTVQLNKDMKERLNSNN